MRQLNKVAVTGASGMLGTAILDRFSDYSEVYATSRTKGLCKENIYWKLFDLLDQAQLVGWLKKVQPHIVIHCAAIVDVDECERTAEKARILHCDTAELIASTITAWNGRLVYISTDAVFDGKLERGYIEDDQPCPLNMYGHTKLLGEIATLNVSNNNIILRTTIFGLNRLSAKRSFAQWILDSLLKKIPLVMFNDVNFTPIHVTHVANIIYSILTSYPNLNGLFHLSGNTKLSKYDFAIKLANEFGLSTDAIFQSTLDKANLLAARSKNMVLANDKLSKVINIEMPTVQIGLACLKYQYESAKLEKIKE